MNEEPTEDIDEPFYEGEIDETIFDETWRVLSQWLAMDKNASDEVLAMGRESERLQRLTDTATESLEQQMNEQWSQSNPVKTPTDLDLAQMKEAASTAAVDMVLDQELYPQVTPQIVAEIERLAIKDDMAISVEVDRARQADPWSRYPRIPDAVKIVRRELLKKPAPFQHAAKALITQRAAGNRPTSESGPVAAEPAAMIAAAIRDRETRR
ncbi:hypothetical protein ACHMZP_30850 [Rhodococcus baikonurensis]|uniref:hypothetical protein n=1 Tax=Rhodococcus baikonurensis TaxID=172041 RepID=UPI0037AFE05B